METIRTTLFLPKPYHRALKNLSVKQHLSMAQLVKLAIERVYFSNKKRKSAKDLWGCVENTEIADKEFQKLKSKLHPQ